MYLYITVLHHSKKRTAKDFIQTHIYHYYICITDSTSEIIKDKIYLYTYHMP